MRSIMTAFGVVVLRLVSTFLMLMFPVLVLQQWHRLMANLVCANRVRRPLYEGAETSIPVLGDIRCRKLVLIPSVFALFRVRTAIMCPVVSSGELLLNISCSMLLPHAGMLLTVRQFPVAGRLVSCPLVVLM